MYLVAEPYFGGDLTDRRGSEVLGFRGFGYLDLGFRDFGDLNLGFGVLGFGVEGLGLLLVTAQAGLYVLDYWVLGELGLRVWGNVNYFTCFH